MSDAVAIRARFERFPAAVKGAFLLRGADGMPHQVRLETARAAELGGGAPCPVPIEPVVLEVAPTMDTFVPFEISTMEMAAAISPPGTPSSPKTPIATGSTGACTGA